MLSEIATLRLRKKAEHEGSVTTDQVIRRQSATPFKPSAIKLVDGRELSIGHPDFVSVSTTDDLITVFDLSSGVEIVDLALVLSLRYGARPAAQTT